MIHLSLPEARQLALQPQLQFNASLPEGKDGTAKIIERLGYIQIDTISVIARAHQHTLWTRQPTYTPLLLDELQANEDRRIFEHWAHAAAYLPISNYRYSLPRMKRAIEKDRWLKKRYEECHHLLKPVLDRIRREGALGSRDFKSDDKKGGTWWDWKPTKIALELLFWMGELMVVRRHNFQKIYDLTERVLPEHIDTTIPTPDELGNFQVRRTLAAHGIALEKEIYGHLMVASRQDVNKALRNLVANKEVVEITIDGIENAIYYALSATLDASSEISDVYLLSPFDNLIIQRNRIRTLFNFDYRLECYVPADKRQYGYYSLPILWGDTFVGRLDPKADRQTKTFIIRNLVFEPEFNQFEELMPMLAPKIKELAVFNQCDQIVVEKMHTRDVKAGVLDFSIDI